MKPEKIVISRTDSIGDVVLTLPLAGVLKHNFPECRIIFLGRKYTEPVIRACKHVELFLDWDEIEGLQEESQLNILGKLKADAFIHVFPRFKVAVLARKAGIPLRIGARRRWFHWLTCNITIPFSRRKSELHEAQLNLKLLAPFGIKRDFSTDELAGYYGFSVFKPAGAGLRKLIDRERINLIFHPGSRGSAVEWGIDNFARLIQLLPTDKYKVFFTGTKEEGELFPGKIPFDNAHIVNLAGKLPLDELISFIDLADGLVASSTGPLHIAAAAGKFVIGLFCPRKPIHPGRWAPIGERVKVLLYNPNCPECERGLPCRCIEKISPEKVTAAIEESAFRR